MSSFDGYRELTEINRAVGRIESSATRIADALERIAAALEAMPTQQTDGGSAPIPVVFPRFTIQPDFGTPRGPDVTS